MGTSALEGGDVMASCSVKGSTCGRKGCQSGYLSKGSPCVDLPPFQRNRSLSTIIIRLSTENEPGNKYTLTRVSTQFPKSARVAGRSFGAMIERSPIGTADVVHGCGGG